MMTIKDQQTLLLETPNLQPITISEPKSKIPEESYAADAAREAVQNELKSLQRSNGRLRRQMSSLKTSNGELRDYAHTVAHNLKDPLSVIILTSEAITDIGDLTSQELQDYLQQIQSTAYAMNATIDNLLLLSEVNHILPPTQPVDMAGVVERVCKRLDPLVKECQGTIDKPKSWPNSIGYAPWIEEIWINYLSNAMKYGGKPPTIRLGATKQTEDKVSYWVQDNGQGIPSQAKKQLFTPFTQFNTDYRPGHGLGLSIVQHMVEKLGGEVGVQSEEGMGSHFFFTLPASP
jgi:two-component system, sensor histidine kinase and response regulator